MAARADIPRGVNELVVNQLSVRAHAHRNAADATGNVHAEYPGALTKLNSEEHPFVFIANDTLAAASEM